mgnify:CR=1 FL=1
MDRKKVLYIALMVVLVALLLFGQWYKRPLDMETITGVTEPDHISISVICWDEDMNLQQRDLDLSAGDEALTSCSPSWRSCSSAVPPPTSSPAPLLPAVVGHHLQGGGGRGLPAPDDHPEPARR